ncbi:MAG: hypothetical protein NZ739_06355 [Verrucomicrobiae bacterium]|nr:hypothetical protein [Verrucomicrobiae bacterium]MCX7722156.1 hypothetical protein [Verrucomicrobiae bacterium]
MQARSGWTTLGLALAAFAFLSWAGLARASGFTYQGILNVAGAPANGSFDMQFSLHDSASSTSVLAGPITIAPVVVTNGLFVVELSFTPSVFDGAPRWLQIGVRRTGETNPYTVLLPRQPVTAAPYAIFAARAAAASNVTGSVQTTNLIGVIPDTLLSSNVALLNRSAVFTGTVTANAFIGNGAGLSNVPCSGLVAIPVGSATQAQPNMSYLATNDAAPVVVTLPQSAALRVGDVVRVSASGAAGWVIRQNAGQVIFVGNLMQGIGVRWAARESSRNWRAVASSADGRVLVAAVNGGQIYISTNYGVSWGAYGVSRNWQAVAISANGRKLVAVANNSPIYTSSDGGVSWVTRENSRTWSSVASSHDGVIVVASVNGGQLYTSWDSGQNWTARESARAWVAVASSANGSNLVAAVSGGQIFVSTNAGVSWVPRGPTKNWVAVASSADGLKLLAAVPGDMLYLSADGGSSWAQAAGSPLMQWTAVAAASDGVRLAAVHAPGGIYISEDAGSSWLLRTGAPDNLSWTSVAVSADGGTVIAGPNGAQLYVSSQATTTPGAAGYLAGLRLAAIELQYIGNGQFIPVSFAGTIMVY